MGNEQRDGFQHERHPDEVLSEAWTQAARMNPMLLAKLGADYDFQRLKELIKECQVGGLPPDDIRSRIVNELLSSAKDNVQPHGRFSDKEPYPEGAK